MNRIVLAAAALPLLAGPAFAQAVTSDPTTAGMTGVPASSAATAGTIANPGQLSSGGSGSSGAGSSGPATNAGQLDFSRTGSGAGGLSSAGAGITTGSTSLQQADDTYLYPLYGKSFR